jgi:hypothetical protein
MLQLHEHLYCAALVPLINYEHIPPWVPVTTKAGKIRLLQQDPVCRDRNRSFHLTNFVLPNTTVLVIVIHTAFPVFIIIIDRRASPPLQKQSTLNPTLNHAKKTRSTDALSNPKPLGFGKNSSRIWFLVTKAVSANYFKAWNYDAIACVCIYLYIAWC